MKIRNVPNLIIKIRIKWAMNLFDPYKSQRQDGIIQVTLQKTEKTIPLWSIAIFRGFIMLTHIPEP